MLIPSLQKYTFFIFPSPKASRYKYRHVVGHSSESFIEIRPFLKSQVKPKDAGSTMRFEEAWFLFVGIQPSRFTFDE